MLLQLLSIAMAKRLSKALIFLPIVIGWSVSSFAIGDDHPDFTAMVVPSQIVVKSPGIPISILMELKVENDGKTPVLIDKFETPNLVIKGEDGDFVQCSSRLLTLYSSEKSDFHVVQPGEATYIPVECGLGVRPNGQVYMGYQDREGAHWTIGPMNRGKYQIVLQYQVKDAGAHALMMADSTPAGFVSWKLVPWEGTIRTKPIEFNIQ